MAKKRTSLRIVLAVLLGAAAVAWCVATWDSHQMKSHLSVFAAEKVLEFQKTAAQTGEVLGEANVTATITAAREYGLYGQGFGKVTVFMRTQARDGSNNYSAIEFYYQLMNDGQWVNTESAMCTGSECRVSAEKAFARDARPVLWAVSSGWF